MQFKKPLLIVAIVLLCANARAESMLDTGKAYTLNTANMTVLQGSVEQTDRHIVCDTSALADRQPALGVSPTTGLPIDTAVRHLPVMVQISNAAGLAKGVTGRTIKAAGLGKAAPWGAQYADIIYESVLFQAGQTRYAFLFYDELTGKQPIHTGPVRSGRIGSMLLSRAWGGGYVYAGMADAEKKYIAQLGTSDRSDVFDLHQDRYHELKARIRGVKAPDNYDVNVSGFEQIALERLAPAIDGFRFTDQCPYGADFCSATRVWLDWGNQAYVSGFLYDAETGCYQRYCGDKGGALWLSFASTEDREPAHMQPLSFRNVIVQRVEYTYLNDNKLLPRIESVGAGNADIFINGRYIAGYWVCEGVDCPTAFFDDQGQELLLNRGKTYIAQLSPLRLLAFAEE